MFCCVVLCCFPPWPKLLSPNKKLRGLYANWFPGPVPLFPGDPGPKNPLVPPLPPLNVNKKEIDLAISILEKVCKTF